MSRLLLALMFLATPALAFKQGEVSKVNFMGCDTPEDVITYYKASLTKNEEVAKNTTCGTITGLTSIYIKEVQTEIIRDTKVHIHEVQIVEKYDGPSQQFAITIEKLGGA